MVSRKLVMTLLVSVMLLSGTGETQAQESASIRALATVISGLTISGITNLQFGTVSPGVSSSVDKATPGFAGEWRIVGSPGAEITFDFTLPDSILLVSDSTNGMPVSFSATDASWDDGSGGGQLAPSGVIDPNGLGTERLGAGGQMTVWVGGTANPRISQSGGDYAEDVLLTVAYTGN